MDVLLLEDEVNTREFFTMLLNNIPGVTKVIGTYLDPWVLLLHDPNRISHKARDTS